MMMGCLYRLTFPSGRAYIGVTMQPLTTRLKQHRNADVRARTAVSAAFRKYGADNVRVETLAVSDSKEYLAIIERRAVEVYGTMVPSGYNVIPGGGYAPGVYQMPEDQKALRRGRKASPETRAKMSAAKLGKKRPPSYSEKLSARNKGNKHARGRWRTYAGVTPRFGKWVASIVIDEKRHYLGAFPTRDEAMSARTAAVDAARAGLPPPAFIPAQRNISRRIGDDALGG